MSQWNSEWHEPGYCEGMDQTILDRMKLLRRQILIHSYLYYGTSDAVIDDKQWDKYARELHDLQKKEGWNINFYDEIFKNWEGQSGFWLPTNNGCDENVVRVALRIVDNNRQKKKLLDKNEKV